MAKKNTALRKTTTRLRPTAAAPARTAIREDVRAFKREIIINAAIDIFFRNGYQTATVDDIAAAISATKAVVYYYFDSKEAVLDAIIGRCSDITLKSVERGVAAGRTPVEKLALACFCFAENILDNQKMIAVYFREERCFSPALHARATKSEKTITTTLSEAIAAGIKRGDFRECDPQLLALNITGMISMSFYWFAEHGRLSKDELCRHFATEGLYFAGYKGEVALDNWLKLLKA